MITPEVRPAIDIDGVSRFAGQVNNELKVIMLHLTPPAEGGESKTPDDLLATLDEYGGFEVARPFSKWYLRLFQDRAADKQMLEPVGDAHRRTLAGEMALGLGGHLLSLGYEHNVPVKTLVGEEGQVFGTGNAARNPIAGRATVLFALTQMTTPKRPWIVQRDLIDAAQEHGIGSGSVRQTLRSLEGGKMLDRERRGRNVAFRIREVPGTPYREAIQEYLRALGQFALLEPSFLVEGQRKAADVFDSAIYKGALSMLLKRTQVTSPKFDTPEPQRRRVNGNHQNA